MWQEIIILYLNLVLKMPSVTILIVSMQLIKTQVKAFNEVINILVLIKKDQNLAFKISHAKTSKAFKDSSKTLV